MLLCCGIVCFDSSLLLFPYLVLNICIFVVSIDILPRQNHPKLQVQKFLDLFFVEDTRVDLLVCIDLLYISVFGTCNYFTIYNNVFMIHITDPKRFYMYLPCICKPIIIECLFFTLKLRKMDPICTCTCSSKTGGKSPGFWDRTGVDAWVMWWMWCDVTRVEISENDG